MWSCASASRVGRGREENQDALLEEPLRGLFAVADGVGGAAQGGRASRLAVEALRRRLADEPVGREPLRRAIEAANREIFALTGEVGRTGTTVAALWADGLRAVIAHVGDSRIYRWRRGRLELLTEDHSLRNELARTGLTAQSAPVEDSVGRLLTRAVGSEPEIEVEARELEVLPGDRFLLLTDGVLELCSSADLRESLSLDPTLRVLVDRLLPPEGGRDDATLIVVEVGGH